MQAHASPCKLAFLAALFFLFSLPAAYSDDSSYVLKEAGTDISVGLKGLVEGLTVGSKVVIENATGSSFKNLIAKSTCGCLKPVEIDGTELVAAGSLSLKFAFLPAADSYRQSCVISGLGEDGKRIDLMTIRFQGDVVPPVRFARLSILRSEIESGTFATKIQSSADVEVNYEKIQSLVDWLRIDADKSGDIRFFWKSKPTDSNVRIRVPLTCRGKKFDYYATLIFVDELLTVAPSQLFFSWKNSEERYVARCVLKSPGLEMAISDIGIDQIVSSADDKKSIDKGILAISIRQMGQNNFVIECRVAKENAEILRNGFVTFSGMGFRSKPMRCTFD